MGRTSTNSFVFGACRAMAMALGFGFLAACGASVTYEQAAGASAARAARPTAQVALLLDGLPPEPHQVVGTLHARQRSQYSTADREAILVAMREEGARRGCDAVVVTGERDEIRGNETDGHMALSRLKGLQGVCIVMGSTGLSAGSPPSQP